MSVKGISMTVLVGTVDGKERTRWNKNYDGS